MGATMTKYRIVTVSGNGLPVTVDNDGYDTELAAEEMAESEHMGEWRVEGYEVARPCECECACGEDATTTDVGVPLCAACAEYTTTEDGEVICSRDDRTEVVTVSCGAGGQTHDYVRLRPRSSRPRTLPGDGRATGPRRAPPTSAWSRATRPARRPSRHAPRTTGRPRATTRATSAGTRRGTWTPADGSRPRAAANEVRS